MNPFTGFLLVILAGALNGSFALPMKGTRRWAFENTWLVYSVVGMVIASWLSAWLTVPDLPSVLSGTEPSALLLVFSFGLIWGLANVLFGVGITMVGMSLAFPICIGLSAALGSIVPMAAHPAVFLTLKGAVTTLGVLVVVAGVILCAAAGREKEKRQGAVPEGKAPEQAPRDPRERSRFARGIAIVLISGICDPCLNFAFTFGDQLKEEAVRSGARPGFEAGALWALVTLGSFVVNAAYCGSLLKKNGTWARYRQGGALGHWLLSALMGVIWMLSITLYGRGASLMGDLGPSIGWAVFYSSIILFSSVWGILAGEWKHGEGRPLKILYGGLLVLVLASAILACGNSLPVG